MAGSSLGTESELELHHEAYTQIFQAVLKKLPIEESARAERLQKCGEYMRASVQGPEDFLSHVGSFAKLLGVKEPALGSFVGANFLKALQLARKARSSAPAAVTATAAGSTAAKGQPAKPEAKYSTILAEIVDRFGSLTSGGHFVPLDDGLLKFVGPDGEQLPASLAGGSPEGSSHASDQAAPAAPASKAGTTPETGAAATSAAAAAFAPAVGQKKPKEKPAPAGPEKSIIKEILEKFGSVLDVHGKLTPRTGPESESDDDDGEDPTSPDAEDVTAAAEPVASVVAPVRSSRKEVTPAAPEKSIIKEILEKFGNALDVHQKLVPRTGPEGEGEDGADQQAGAAALSTQSEVGDDTNFEQGPPRTEPLPVDFEIFTSVLRKVQHFQTNQQEDQYRQWLMNEASVPEKALVGLRNLDIRSRSSNVDFEREYKNIAAHLDGVVPDQIRDLHRRMAAFGQVHQLVGKVRAALQGKPAPLVAAIKRVWPNFLQLLNEQTDADGYVAEFRIAMLQIPDEKLRGHVEAFLKPVFERLARIYAALD